MCQIFMFVGVGLKKRFKTVACRVEINSKQGLINEKEVYYGISFADDYFKYLDGNNKL